VKAVVKEAGERWVPAELMVEEAHLPQHSLDVSQEVAAACALRLKR